MTIRTWMKITMTNPLPWDGIGIPSRDYTVRKVGDAGAIPLYWGRDTAGRCLFIVELAGDHADEFRRGAVAVHGIGVDLREGEFHGQQRLILTLDRNVDQDLFLGLCQTLVAALFPVVSAATALSVALAHIKRWKAFLAGRKARRLTPQEVRGLWAELAYLRAVYRSRLSSVDAVNAWCGVEAVHQDFIFGNTAVEVKSLAGQDRSTVRISSEDQLETIVDDLYLVTHRLTENPDATDSLSLNALVRLVESELGDAEALEEFSGKLAGFGYLPIVEYDAPAFQISERRTYRVGDAFPRLTRSGLPTGIARVSYEIELEAIEDFACDCDQVLKGG